jgi:hypothetical protein
MGPRSLPCRLIFFFWQFLSIRQLFGRIMGLLFLFTWLFGSPAIASETRFDGTVIFLRQTKFGWYLFK